MNKVEKLKLLSLSQANAEADIKLINQYSLKELTPEEVFVFSVILCDNEVDRDLERFTNESLEALAPLFLGKVGISDHDWTMDRQIARLYRTEVVDTGEMTSIGEPKKVLRGDAYMLRLRNDRMIAAVEGGIIKEVSVGCAIGGASCSICGAPMRWGGCGDGHEKGQEYDGKLCYADLNNPKDAYEFSFVAVPAQRGAGVTKSAKDLDGLFDDLMAADISALGEDKIKSLIVKGQSALLSEEERKKRAEIIAKYKTDTN